MEQPAIGVPGENGQRQNTKRQSDMNTPIALLLVVVFLLGVGLFAKAYIQGMRFGERMEEKKNRRKEEEKQMSQPDSTNEP